MSLEMFTMAPYVRTTHPDGFRSGQWAKLLAVRILPRRHGPKSREPRLVYVVEFVDGVQDHWVVDDPAAGYEFSASASGLDAFRLGEGS